VIEPSIGAGIEKAYEITRLRNGSDVASFGSVAESTGESEVVNVRGTAMF